MLCVQFQNEPLKFNTKCLTHTIKDVDFSEKRKFKSSQICERPWNIPPRIKSWKKHEQSE